MSPHLVAVQALLIPPFQLGTRFAPVQKAVESPIRVVVLSPVGACSVFNREQ